MDKKQDKFNYCTVEIGVGRGDKQTCHFNDLMPGDVIKGMVPGQVGGASVKALGDVCL